MHKVPSTAIWAQVGLPQHNYQLQQPLLQFPSLGTGHSLGSCSVLFSSVVPQAFSYTSVKWELNAMSSNQ